MDNLLYIYFLSISENLNNTLDSIGKFCFTIAVVAYLVFFLRKVTVLEGTYGDERRSLESRFTEHELKVRKLSICLGFMTVVFWTSSALCPSTENVLKAYALIEGSKVINAPNAEKAAEAIGKRFDHFLDIVDRGITGRSNGTDSAKKEEKPAVTADAGVLPASNK
jgi:hypothetical protein